jgi:hypothetical protein
LGHVRLVFSAPEKITTGATHPDNVPDDAKGQRTPTFFYDEDALFGKSEARTPFDGRFLFVHLSGCDLSRRYNAIPVNENTLYQ